MIMVSAQIKLHIERECIMKFCSECGTQLTDAAKFCVKCGTPCAAGIESNSPPSIEQDAFSRYYGMTFKDIFSKVIELTPQGVYIYRHKGMWLKFDNVIPYKHIVNVALTRPGFQCGSLSIVTANGGLKAEYDHKERMSTKYSNELANNQNVICFRKMVDIQTIYDALTAIVND